MPVNLPKHLWVGSSHQPAMLLAQVSYLTPLLQRGLSEYLPFLSRTGISMAGHLKRSIVSFSHPSADGLVSAVQSQT